MANEASKPPEQSDNPLADMTDQQIVEELRTRYPNLIVFGVSLNDEEEGLCAISGLPTALLGLLYRIRCNVEKLQ